MRIGFSILGHDMHVLDGRAKIILLAPREGLPYTNVFRAECSARAHGPVVQAAVVHVNTLTITSPSMIALARAP